MLLWWNLKGCSVTNCQTEIPLFQFFYSNGALLGQRHVGLRYIAYWPDNLPTCILKILVQRFHKSPDEVNKPVTQQYMLCQIFEREKK